VKAGLLPDEGKSGTRSMWVCITVGEYKICHYPTLVVSPWDVTLGDTSVSFETLDECISFVKNPRKTSLADNPFVARALDPKYPR